MSVPVKSAGAFPHTCFKERAIRINYAAWFLGSFNIDELLQAHSIFTLTWKFDISLYTVLESNDVGKIACIRYWVLRIA
ncbi:MAG: hypothetical protein CM15mP22_7890 [Gammaproteobacteria bacterium]|nr:MAG: hypothetical protein CM15mP22_7890 [Gammaproteobacteria bacterium]